MGLFGRKKDDEGFYTGDSPVIGPGFDGAAPSAYVAPPSAPSSSANAGAYPDYDAGVTVGPVGTAGSPTASWSTAPPSAPPPQSAASPPSAPPPGARTIDPATAARIQQALAGSSTRASRGLAFAIILPLVGAIIAVGVGLYVAFAAKDAASTVIAHVPAFEAPADASAAEPASDHRLTSLGDPVSVSVAGATFDLVVYGAVTQRGGGWGYTAPGDEPVLVVDAQITRTDAGAEPVEFLGWNWTVTEADGTVTGGDIISHFEPSLDGPELIGGQSVRGYIAFRTAATQVALAVADGPARLTTPQAVWQLTAARPSVVAGTFGEPVLPEISRPGFTATVDAPEVIKKKDPRVGYRPESGRYLAFPVEFIAVPGAAGHLGIVERDRFVFLPDSGPAVIPTFGGVDDAFSFASVDAAAPERGYFAFDTTATTGELQWRDGADRVIAIWHVG